MVVVLIRVLISTSLSCIRSKVGREEGGVGMADWIISLFINTLLKEKKECIKRVPLEYLRDLHGENCHLEREWRIPTLLAMVSINRTP